MRKAAHHSGGMVSWNPRRWRGERLHHHGGGVCWLFVLLCMDSWRHETIVCKKWYKNNPKVGLCGVTFWPTLACTTPLLFWRQSKDQHESIFIKSNKGVSARDFGKVCNTGCRSFIQNSREWEEAEWTAGGGIPSLNIPTLICCQLSMAWHPDSCVISHRMSTRARWRWLG